MTVSATVEETCHLLARPLVFGAFPREHPAIDARSSVVLTCTPSAAYVVAMDDGRHSAGGARRMADATGTRHLAYEIYSDAALTRRWGAGPVGAVSAIAPPGGHMVLDVFGRVTAGSAAAGVYGDTITVTIAF